MEELILKYRASARLLLGRMKELDQKSFRYSVLYSMYKDTCQTAKEMEELYGNLGDKATYKVRLQTVTGRKETVEYRPRPKKSLRHIEKPRPGISPASPNQGYLDVTPEAKGLFDALLHGGKEHDRDS